MKHRDKMIGWEDIPEQAQFAIGQDLKIHAFSMFGDAWCDDEREVWGEDSVERVESFQLTEETYKTEKDLCAVCFADGDHQMDIAEELWG